MVSVSETDQLSVHVVVLTGGIPARSARTRKNFIETFVRRT